MEPGLHHRGTLVLSEAIGDLAGVRLAYLAFQRSSERQRVPVRVGLTLEQQFFIAFGQLRGDAVRLEAEREMADGGPSPGPEVPCHRAPLEFARVPEGVRLSDRSRDGEAAREALRGLGKSLPRRRETSARGHRSGQRGGRFSMNASIPSAASGSSMLDAIDSVVVA